MRFALIAVGLLVAPLHADQPLMLVPELQHVRSGDAREWDEFPREAPARRLEAVFHSQASGAESTIDIRQQDVRRKWSVRLNDAELGQLTLDEGDLTLRLPVPAGALVPGENRLRIECESPASDPSDDIRVGEIVLHPRPASEVQQECRLAVRVIDSDTQRLMPARITILSPDGALEPVAAESEGATAVRTGCVYTGSGEVVLKLSAGNRRIHAGRGFEFSLAQTEVSLAPGETRNIELRIRRVVPTEGYIACDTHIHSRTHSGHGDATVEERMATIAGEGIELPIATDHNVQIDLEPFARQAGVRDWFTSVIGNEVTTKQGHFNVFPIEPGAPVIDHARGSWEQTFAAIAATPGPRITILNHARDIHSGTRPFGPKLHNAVVGENLQGWPIGFNAMEVINSGATQSDPLQLIHDWMGLLNRGHRITPIGSSDSHDVTRYIVGQGRTYIRGDDSDPADIDVEDVVENLVQGRVLVSYGLIAELQVDGQFDSGDLATVPKEVVPLRVRVLGPEWVVPRRLRLYANGQLVREEALPEQDVADGFDGVHYEATWEWARPAHDVFLSAVVLGDGIDAGHWRTAKPYQPVHPHWEPHTLGCSGAVFLDADGDGAWSSARAYAERVVAKAQPAPVNAVVPPGDYDAAVAAQTAHLLRLQGIDLESDEMKAALSTAGEAAQQGFRDYLAAWRENQIAQFE